MKTNAGQPRVTAEYEVTAVNTMDGQTPSISIEVSFDYGEHLKAIDRLHDAMDKILSQLEAIEAKP